MGKSAEDRARQGQCCEGEGSRELQASRFGLTDKNANREKELGILEGRKRGVTSSPSVLKVFLRQGLALFSALFHNSSLYWG